MVLRLGANLHLALFRLTTTKAHCYNYKQYCYYSTKNPDPLGSVLLQGTALPSFGRNVNPNVDNVVTRGVADVNDVPPPPALAVDEGGAPTLGPPSTYFDFSKSFNRSETWLSNLVRTMKIYPSFICSQEELSILKEIEPVLSRLHYEDAHWDDAIHDYRETERGKWNVANEKIIGRIRALAFPPGVPQLKLVHILDLGKSGVIKPHIDSVRFCGNTIAGLSLLSDSVMRLRHDVQKDFYCDIFLPRYSLYVMSEFARFEFTHEILGDGDSMFKSRKVNRDRRVSVICRNEPVAASNGPIFTQLNSTT